MYTLLLYHFHVEGEVLIQPLGAFAPAAVAAVSAHRKEEFLKPNDFSWEKIKRV